MARIQDQEYLKLCAELASFQSISLASARRKVDLAAARDGMKDLNYRKLLAERLIKEVKIQNSSSKLSASAHLDELLEALAEEENFMVED